MTALFSVLSLFWTRTARWAIPPFATCEALANTLCHRDCSISGGSIGVAIHDDRLEFMSTGSLQFGMTREQLFVPHEFIPWNPAIAEAFCRRGVMERWGRGTLRMPEVTVAAGPPQPQIEDTGGYVVACKGMSNNEHSSASAHFSLVRLGEKGTRTDRRRHKRRQKFDQAVMARQSVDSESLRILAVKTALGKGYFRVWMAGSKDNNDMRQSLIYAFPGTRVELGIFGSALRWLVQVSGLSLRMRGS